jgi:predicted oxidoreductase
MAAANTLFSPVISGCMNWGAWGARFNAASYLKMIEECLDAGVTSFDHADIYGHYTTETEFGEALKHAPGLRQRMQLITKCGICMVTPNRPAHQIKHYNTSREHIIASAERSLVNLNTDHIDLLLIHRPDPLMDPAEVAEAFTRLRQSGKVLHFGVSNFNTAQVDLLRKYTPVEVNQVEISILHPKPLFDGVVEQCMREDIIPQAWSPIGGGKTILDPEDERSRRVMAMAQILGERYNAGFDQVLLAWLMQHPAGILPVLGTTRADRIKDAMRAADIRMSREEWFMLLRASTGHEVA